MPKWKTAFQPQTTNGPVLRGPFATSPPLVTGSALNRAVPENDHRSSTSPLIGLSSWETKGHLTQCKPFPISPINALLHAYSRKS